MPTPKPKSARETKMIQKLSISAGMMPETRTIAIPIRIVRL